jgi:VWFA-related protein
MHVPLSADKRTAGATMREELRTRVTRPLIACACAAFLLACAAYAWPQQDGRAKGDGEAGARPRKSEVARGSVRSVTIPVTPTRRGDNAAREELQVLDLVVQEDGEPQEILSARGADRAPLALAVVLQDDLASSVANELRGLTTLIRGLPAGSRVLVAYLRAGSPQIRQRFTTDLEKAVKGLRIPAGSPFAAPYNPYAALLDVLKRFEPLPTGRRAVLLVSDGVDISRGIDSSAPGQSLDLTRAIAEAQRRGVAVYSIYSPTALTAGGNFVLSGNGQSSLKRLSEETGGRAYYQGSGAPVSFDPFLRELGPLLNRQFALTYLSTHPNKDFHRIKLQSVQTDVHLAYPTGYTPK